MKRCSEHIQPKENNSRVDFESLASVKQTKKNSTTLTSNRCRVIRARGLPWQSTEDDLINFFVGLNIVSGGIVSCLSQAGRRNGEAMVKFETFEQRQLALARHKHFMAARYIEVYAASDDEFDSVAAGKFIFNKWIYINVTQHSACT